MLAEGNFASEGFSSKSKRFSVLLPPENDFNWLLPGARGRS